MNVAEFALRVTGAVGIDAATASSGSSQEYTLFLSWLNEAVLQFLTLTKCTKRTATLSVTAGSADYALDTDILAFEDAYYNPNDGTSRMLRQMDSSDIRQARLNEASSVDPQFYAYEGQVIMLYPSPISSTDTLHIVYVARPSSALAATGDAPSATAYGGVPVEYHTVLESYVKWKAAEHANDAATKNGQAWREEWESGVQRAKINESRKGGLKIGQARVGYQRDWRNYAAPGVDLGY